MNSVVSKFISQTAAKYQAPGAAVVLSNHPAEDARTPRTGPASKSRLDVELDWNSDSTLYSDFGTEPVGVFVATHMHLPIGTVVDLEIALPDGRIIATTGRVQWTQEPRDLEDGTRPGVGIQFTQVAEHPSWNPPRPAVVSHSMPPVRVVSIHPLCSEDASALNTFGQIRQPTFYID